MLILKAIGVYFLAAFLLNILYFCWTDGLVTHGSGMKINGPVAGIVAVSYYVWTLKKRRETRKKESPPG